MSLAPAQISDLVALGAPILCLDTCTILDVVRDITRETIRLSDAKAGVIVSFQQIDTVAAGQAVASPMRRLGM